MAQALYRKWRSQTFDEVVGQEHVVRTLTSALAQGRIAHAYLFAGPRGTGKTTMARLLAKAVNCLAEDGPKPCNRCAVCQALNEGRLIDLIEIDGASNRGIDEVRTLREQVNFSPNVARYKVYIIDEVHMLTPEAFNALLKTLEEPPAHVIFILATTEVHKLPPTIISRCQRFDFRRIPLDLITQRLRLIADTEGIHAEQAALELIARSATGSMRDAISLLDQLSAYGSDSITREQVQAMLGAVSVEPLADLVDAVIHDDLKAALGIVAQLVDQGLDPRQLTAELLDYARDLLQVKAGNPPALTAASAQAESRMRAQAEALRVDDLLRLSRLLTQASLEIKGNILPQLPLELALTEAILKPEARPAQASQAAPAPTSTTRPAAPREAPKPQPVVGPQAKREEPTMVEAAAGAPATPPAASAGVVDLDAVQWRWNDFVENLRNCNPRTQALSAQALLRSGVPMSVDGDVIVIGFPSEFHRKKISEDAPKALVEKALAEALGVPRCAIRGVVVSPQELKAAAEAARAGANRKAPTPATPDAAVREAADPLVEYAANNLGAVAKPIAPEESSSVGEETS
ncbi:MAG: DNA polymerase III subunit gamma/tau [Chloroflexi bacterium]|nr:DNA polymerase III subunit gamma/tau [Chloroflexota bacterium]